MKFELNAPFKPTGDQPQAIEKLTAGLDSGKNWQTLLGVTGSGKTFSMASVIERVQRPALIVSHNKTLAAQLYQEFREFFPNNSVHYFTSYYDYYQPEAYIPETDLYIEKDAKINDELDRLRHGATQAVLNRRDVIIVASVSCIYGIGSPQEYEEVALKLFVGQEIPRRELMQMLVALQYARNEVEFYRGNFRVRGGALEVAPVFEEAFVRISWQNNTISQIQRIKHHYNPLLGHKIEYRLLLHGAGNQKAETLTNFKIYPAKHFVTPRAKLRAAINDIGTELTARLEELKTQGKLLEAERLNQRTRYDIEVMRETGYCAGVENYERHLAFRKPGEPPATISDYFPKDFLTIIDESHMTIPQLHGMYHGDRTRKKTLVEHGFRLPSALDHRPLKFEEFVAKTGQKICISATPGPYELKASTLGRITGLADVKLRIKTNKGAYLNIESLAEQLIRPTGLLDPIIEVRPAEKEIRDVQQEIEREIQHDGRVLLLTLTKQLAEDITDYLIQRSIKAKYLHSEIHTLDRPDILKDLRLGKFQVLVGINLLREGLDIPEVSLVAILDADKEGFLRNETSLIQTMGRAARHPHGRVILYADRMTRSIKAAVKETLRRRKIQETYNQEHGITPKAIEKPIREDVLPGRKKDAPGALDESFEAMAQRDLERAMRDSAKNLDFETAALLRDRIAQLKGVNRA